MKILMRILGVLILLVGLVIGGVGASSDLVKEAEDFVSQADKDFKSAEAEMKFSQSSESKTSFEAKRQSLNTWEGYLKQRKQSRLIGFVVCGALVVLGIGLFGISFLFGNKR